MRKYLRTIPVASFILVHPDCASNDRLAFEFEFNFNGKNNYNRLKNRVKGRIISPSPLPGTSLPGRIH